MGLNVKVGGSTLSVAGISDESDNVTLLNPLADSQVIGPTLPLESLADPSFCKCIPSGSGSVAAGNQCAVDNNGGNALEPVPDRLLGS